MRPRLTRRGWATVGVVLVAVANAAAFGPRSLNAVAAPLLLSVVAAVVVTYRADRPTLHRGPPEGGFAGGTGTVSLRFDVEAPVSGVVEDRVGDGLAADARVDTTVTDDPVEYGVEYRRRGVRQVGPASLTVRDVLGLARVTFAYEDADDVLVYPRTYELAGADRHELALLEGGAPEREREAFDRLREYEPGDRLRDVHWKTTAKQASGDPVVMEFVADDEVGEMTVAVGGDPGTGDRTASAAASVALFMLDAGVSVGLISPDGRLGADSGPAHRRRILEHLARVGTGDPPEGALAGADVAVYGGAEGVSVRIETVETSFRALAGLPADWYEGELPSVGGGRRRPGEDVGRATGTPADGRSDAGPGDGRDRDRGTGRPEHGAPGDAPARTDGGPGGPTGRARDDSDGERRGGDRR